MFNKIRRGARYLPGYGEHPGTPILFILVLLGALAGSRHGIEGTVFGAIAMLLMFGPLWCWVC